MEYNNALSTNPIPADVVRDLSDALKRVELTGMVSQADVAPYIDQFPPHIGLEDFDAEPSKRNVEMATESMAAFLKIGLALAVIGAIGYVVFNLIASRKKCQKIETEEGWRAFLFKEINDSRSLIMNSPCWLNRGMMGANGFNLENAIDNYLTTNPSASLALEGEGKRLFSRSFYGKAPNFTEKSGIVQYGDVLAQGAAIGQVRTLLNGAAERIQNGKASEVIADLEKALSMSPIDRLTNSITTTMGDVLPRVGIKPGQTQGQFLFEVAELLETYFENLEQSSTSVDTELKLNIVSLGGGSPALPVSLSETNLSSVSEACKKSGADCEKLKTEARGFKLNEEVEKTASSVIEEINSITKAGGRLIDLAAAEATSALRHARWMAGVHVEILKMAEEILKHNHEGAKASKLESKRKELERAIKKAA